MQRLAQDCRRPKGERGVRSALNVINRIGLAVKDRPSRRLPWVWKLNVGGLDWPMVYNRAAGSEPEIQTTLQNRSESPVRHFRAGGGKRARARSRLFGTGEVVAQSANICRYCCA